MGVHELRQEARGLLRQIKEDPISPSLACVKLSQALALMSEIHNESVEPEARQKTVHIPTITDEHVTLLRRALTGDFDPLLRWLNPRVVWDPSWILSIFP